MWRIFRRDAVEVLYDERVRASLSRYFAVMNDEKPAKFMIAKKIPAEFDEDEPLESLWAKHEKLTENFYRIQGEIDSGKISLKDIATPEKSYLDLKIAIAKRILERCHLCNRRCGVNRLKGELGYCRCGTQITVSSIFEHIGEEPELVPSGTIFTMGCTIRCLHCQNWTICITGDSLVLLSDGTLTEIAKIFDEYATGEPKEVYGSLCAPTNLNIFSINEEAKATVDLCNGVSRRLANDLIEIVTRTGRKIVVTSNHLLYTCHNGLIIPVPAEKLREGDYIAALKFIPEIKGFTKINIGNPTPKAFYKNAPTITITSELCRVIGYLLGDGHLYKRKNHYNIVFTNTNQSLIEDYVNCFKKVFGLTPKVLEYKGIFRAIVRSANIFNFLSEIAPHLLSRSKFREVPWIIMRADNNMVSSFLRGFFDCEATVHSKNKEIVLYSASERLLLQVQILLCRYGIISQLHPVFRKRNGRVEKTFRLSITGENLSRYKIFVGFSSPEKIEKLEEVLKLRASPRQHIDVIPNISDLLKDIRSRLRLTQRNVSLVLKGYGYLESKNRPFPRFKLEKVASFFEDRLRNIEMLSQNLAEPTWKVIREGMRMLNISQRELAEMLNVSRSLIKYYMNMDSNDLYAKKFLSKVSAAIRLLCLEILSDRILLEDLFRLKMLVNADIFWDKVERTSKLTGETLVFDIRVQNTNRFIANGLLVHNSQWFESGEVYSPRRLALAVEGLRKSGCRNANLVGGEPTPWLEQWLETFNHVNVNIPVVWNSNSYYSEETARLLAGFVDVYLLDFKYGPFDCAKRISDAPNYWDVCTRNHIYGGKYGELIIRVLVLPNHLECCTKHILKWIADNLGKNTRTNVMFQYRPEWRAYEVPELRRRLTAKEMERAIDLAKEAGLTNFIT
ncbi:MAG: LAGLIDADG family homing endonuclease [Candidatus Bathyarchaeia archaeon]